MTRRDSSTPRPPPPSSAASGESWSRPGLRLSGGRRPAGGGRSPLACGAAGAVQLGRHRGAARPRRRLRRLDMGGDARAVSSRADARPAASADALRAREHRRPAVGRRFGQGDGKQIAGPIDLFDFDRVAKGEFSVPRGRRRSETRSPAASRSSCAGSSRIPSTQPGCAQTGSPAGPAGTTGCGRRAEQRLRSPRHRSSRALETPPSTRRTDRG